MELVRRARGGDEKALDRLLARYLPMLRRWASGRLPRWARDGVDTDDIVQDILLQTVRNVEAFEPRHDRAFQGYVRQALHNRIQDEIRRAVRRPAVDSLPDTQRDPAPSPVEYAIGAEALERYERALAQLREEERVAIVSRIEMGLDYRQLAELMGRPSPDAARVAVSRALVKLAREMSDG